MIVEYALAFLVIFSVVFFILLFFQPRQEKQPARPKVFPTISVIVPAHNEEAGIKSTIKSVAASDYPEKSKLEIIVVDDGSTDSTLSKAKEAVIDSKVTVKVLAKANEGKSSALNYGIKHSRAELIATLDADCIVEPQSVVKLVSFFTDNSVMAATAAVKVREPRNWLQRMQEIEYLFILFNRKLLASLDGVYVTPGPLSVFRRKVFDELGGFKAGNVMEDQEIALRIQSRNYRIVSSMDAVVLTNPPSTFSQLIRQRVRWNRGGMRNLLEYAFLVHPSYGDLGVLILPLWFLSVLALLAVFGLVANSVLSGQWGQFFKYGLFIPIVYGVDPLVILSLISVVLGLFWLALGWWFFRNEKIGVVHMALYFFVYPLLSAVFWIATFVKELKGEPLQW